jgi:hypothetical protein
MDGWEIAQYAREIDPEFPVVYMSGAAAADWASKGVPNSIMLSKLSGPASYRRLEPSQQWHADKVGCRPEYRPLRRWRMSVNGIKNAKILAKRRGLLLCLQQQTSLSKAGMTVSCQLGSAAITRSSRRRGEHLVETCSFAQPGLPHPSMAPAASRSARPARVRKRSTLVPIPLYISARFPFSVGRYLTCRWMTTEQNSNQRLPPRKMKWLA